MGENSSSDDKSSSDTTDSGTSSVKSRQPLPLNLNIQSYLGHCHLTSDNYMNWRSIFMSVIATHTLHDTLTTKDPPPAKLSDGTDNPNFSYLTQASNLVLGWLKATVSAKVQARVNPCVTASSAWTLLEKRFGGKSRIHIQKLKTELNALSKKPEVSIDDYFQQAITLSDSLAKAGEIVTDEDLQQRIISGLGPQFKEFITSQNNHPAESLDDLQDLLLQEEDLLTKFNSVTLNPTSALVAASNTVFGSSSYNPSGGAPSPTQGSGGRGRGSHHGGRNSGRNNSRQRNGHGGGRGILPTPGYQPKPFNPYPNPTQPHTNPQPITNSPTLLLMCPTPLVSFVPVRII